MEGLGGCRHHGPNMCHLFLSSPDSGYLFSGSRPPSQVSRSGEAPVSGKEDGELLSTGAAWAWVSRASCGWDSIVAKCEL